MLLAGESGIDKTRIAYELAHYAEAQGVRLLWGWCYEGEGAPLLVLRYISPRAVPRYMRLGSTGRNMKVHGGAPVFG